MPVRTLHVALTPEMEFEPLLDAALAFAQKLQGHLEVSFLQPDLTSLSADYAMTVAAASYPIIAYDELLSQRRRRAEAAHAVFEGWRHKHALPDTLVDHMIRSCYARWTQSEDQPEVAFIHRARLADVTILQLKHKRYGLETSLLDAALFESGRPVLLLRTPLVTPPLDHVALAWNGSLQAVRSLAHATPFLHAADTADIFFVPSPRSVAHGRVMIEPEEVAEALRWQGVRARVIRIAPQPDEPVGAALLRVAGEEGVSLLAMGAFTHSRLREAMLGGVTRHVLDHAGIPVMMSY